MGYMATRLNQDACLIGMIQSKMVGSLTHLTIGVMTVGSILVMVQRDNIFITVTIRIRGVRSSTF